MTSSLPPPGLRPYLPADAPVLADLFRESIAELTGDDYSPDQQAEWAATADDEEEFGATARRRADPRRHHRRRARRLRLAQGQGPGRYALRPAVGGGTGARRPCCSAPSKSSPPPAEPSASPSTPAIRPRDFFERRGFRAQRRNTVPLGGEWLANTTMEKALADAPEPSVMTREPGSICSTRRCATARRPPASTSRWTTSARRRAARRARRRLCRGRLSRRQPARHRVLRAGQRPRGPSSPPSA